MAISIPLKSIKVANGVIQVNVKLGNQNNPFAQVEKSYLSCTCGKLGCNHIHNAEAEYKQWKRLQLSKLKGQYDLNTPSDVLLRRVNKLLKESDLDFEIQNSQVVSLGNGDFALQVGINDIHLRYSGNGWGYGGSQAVIVEDPELQALIETVSHQEGIEVWDWEVHKCFYFKDISPIISSPLDNYVETENRIGEEGKKLGGRFSAVSSNIIRLGDSLEQVESKRNGSLWPAWWVQLAGLQLSGNDIWGGESRILVENTINGNHIYGLAIDLSRNLIKPLGQREVKEVIGGVPYEGIGRTHLPWGPEGAEYAQWQVVLCKKDYSELSRDCVMTLYTQNLWGYEVNLVIDILPMISRYLTRLGFNPDSHLFYQASDGFAFSMISESLAKNAINCPPENIKKEAMTLLQALIEHRFDPKGLSDDLINHGLEAFLPPIYD